MAGVPSPKGILRRLTVLFLGVGEGWAARELLVEHAAADHATRVACLDLHRRTNAPWPYVRDRFTRLLSRRELAALLPAGTMASGSPVGPTFLASSPRRG